MYKYHAIIIHILCARHMIGRFSFVQEDSGQISQVRYPVSETVRVVNVKKELIGVLSGIVVPSATTHQPEQQQHQQQQQQQRQQQQEETENENSGANINLGSYSATEVDRAGSHKAHYSFSHDLTAGHRVFVKRKNETHPEGYFSTSMVKELRFAQHDGKHSQVLQGINSAHHLGVLHSVSLEHHFHSKVNHEEVGEKFIIQKWGNYSGGKVLQVCTSIFFAITFQNISCPNQGEIQLLFFV